LVIDCRASGKSFEEHQLVPIGKPLIPNSTAGIYSNLLYRSPWLLMSFLKKIPPETIPEESTEYVSNFLEHRYNLFSKKAIFSEEETKDWMPKFEIIDALSLGFLKASQEYGKTRKDSIYWKGEK
jgi:hypothetical protein